MGLYDLCKDYIDEAQSYHEDAYFVHRERKKSFHPRRLIPCVVAVGGFTGKEHSTNRYGVTEWKLCIPM